VREFQSFVGQNSTALLLDFADWQPMPLLGLTTSSAAPMLDAQILSSVSHDSFY
jgi:hypothetical protein